MRRVAMLLILASALVGAAAAAPAHASVEWLCRPGAEPNPCRESLETTVYEAGGQSHVENPPLPEDPPIDCFYVYPTVSEQPGTNANKDKDASLMEIARYQAARFSQRCKVYAPVYRQLTLASINLATADQRAQGGRLAYGDVREAWLDYLAHYNHGRGFILLGHSQGTRMLRQLVREEVDPKLGVRRRLVNATLLGNNVLVRKGQRIGGDFSNIPACAAADQIRCVIAWSTFNDPPPSNSRFGRSPDSDTTGAGFPSGPSYEVLCSNPASLGANGREPLTSYLRSKPPPGIIGALIVETYGGPPPSAPTPWLQPAERYTGRCEQSAGANVLMLNSIGGARKLNPAPDPSWGLHITDANIALGEEVEIARRAGANYVALRTPHPRIVGRRLRVTRKRRVWPIVACRGEDDLVCRGRVRLRRGRQSFGTASFAVRATRRRRVRVAVPRRARALARRRGVARVRAELLERGTGKRTFRTLIRLRPARRRG